MREGHVCQRLPSFVLAALLSSHRRHLAGTLCGAIVPFSAVQILSSTPRTAQTCIEACHVERRQGSVGLPVNSSQRTGLATPPCTRHHRVGCPSRAASASVASRHVHVWLHWPKLSTAHNTNGGPANAIVKHLRRFSGQGHATYSACVHQPNRSFNRDVNAPHCRPLTLGVRLFVKSSICLVFWPGFVL
jgi:hypothetical protein